jgi:hypothetical protein
MKCLALVLTIERVWATLVMILFLVFVRRNEQHLEAEVEQALRKYDILSWLKDNA